MHVHTSHTHTHTLIILHTDMDTVRRFMYMKALRILRSNIYAILLTAIANDVEIYTFAQSCGNRELITYTFNCISKLLIMMNCEISF